ncbi:MAG: helix-turn-helix domain-containing protein [Streptosporangiaceae bacterium]
MASLLADAVEGADGMGRPLFSGRRADGRPQDAVHCLWWACGLVREHRGDSHVAAASAGWAVHAAAPAAGSVARWSGMVTRTAPALVSTSLGW